MIDKPVALVGVPMDLGGGRRGVDMGPSAMRIADLGPRVRELGLEFEDHGNVEVHEPETVEPADERARFLPEIASSCVRLRRKVEALVGEGRFPVVIGGDHSIAVGTIAGLTSYYHKHGARIGLIWFDAHGDMNTPETTESGNIHGMPLAACLGRGPDELTRIGDRYPMVEPRNTTLVGVRSLDNDERELLHSTGIRCFTMKEIDLHGIHAVMREAIARATLGTAGFHLSFDMDGTDPEVAPGVGTPVPGGVSYRESHTVMELVAESGKLLGLEITEINPILDERNRTARTAVEFVLSALGKTTLERYTARVFDLLRSLLRHRRLLKDFVVRDLKARYVGSTMGFFWSVVFPIINLFVYMFVFRLVLNARWSDSQGALEVAIVMLAGIVVWTAFAETISRATNTLVDNANLIQKVVFPAEILPSYLTFSSLINMCIGLPVVLGSVFWFGHVSPPKAYLHVPHQWVPVEGQETHERHPVIDRIGEWDRRKDADDKRAHEYAARVYLTRAWRKDVRIPFRVSGTATRGSDYLLPGDEVVIPRGELMGLLVIVPLSDDDPTEGDETVVIELDPATDVPLLETEEITLGSGKVVERGDGVDEGGPRIEFVIADAGPAEADALPGGNPGVFIPGKQRDPKDIKEVYHPLSLGPGLVILPVLFLLQVVFTVGLAYFLAAFNLFLRDTFHLVGVAITVWMFSTPIFYPGAMVQEAGFGWILAVNPMHWLIDSYRSVLLYGVWPDPKHIVMLVGASLLTLFLGGRFFMAQRSKFPDLL